MNGLIWFWPAVAVSIVASRLLASRAARALNANWWVAWLLVISLGVIVSATLTPIHAPGGIDIAAERPCDLSRRWFASPTEIIALTDVTLNLAVFIPFGFAVGLLPISGRTFAVVVAATALPPAIEGLQFLVPVLARGCQSGDVVDSLTGLAVGMAAAIVARSLRSLWARIRPVSRP